MTKKQETVTEKMDRMRAISNKGKPQEPEDYRKVSDEEFTDSHDALTKAYLDYFDAYFLYLKQDSVRTYYACQKRLKHLTATAKLLQLDCQDNFYKNRLRPGVRKQRKKNGKHE